MQHIPHSITFLFHKKSAGDRHRRHFRGHFVVVLTRKGTVPTLHIVPGPDQANALILAQDICPRRGPDGQRLSQSLLGHSSNSLLWLWLGFGRAIHLRVDRRVRHDPFFDLRKQHWIFKRKSIFVKNEIMADSDVKPKTNRLPIPLHSHPNLRQSGLAQAEAEALSRMQSCARMKPDAIGCSLLDNAIQHTSEGTMCTLGTMPFVVTKATKWP